MKSLALFMTLIAGQSLAQVQCTLTDTACAAQCRQTHVSFTIDRNQFVAPHNPQDPPRRQVTQVTQNAATFIAQAIAMDSGAVGFHHTAEDAATTLMIVQPDGSARLSRQPQGQVLAGSCTGP